MKRIEINSKIDDFRLKIENLNNQEKKLKKDIGIEKKENDEVNKRYKIILKSKQSHDINVKAKKEASDNKLAIFSYIFAICVLIIFWYIVSKTSNVSYRVLKHKVCPWK